MPDPYDEVRYPSLPLKQSHPAFVAALATIAGLELPPVERWRVLEIACGDGSNIVPLAFDYPEGQFVGMDRALNPVQAGRSLIRRLKLSNIELLHADLPEWRPEGEFDYIIAHGIFSWAPAEVREAILRVCGSTLKPRGIAFISYNALPGCHFRRIAWDFLRYHLRHVPDPAVRMEKARDLARAILKQPAGEKTGDLALRHEMSLILKKDATVLYHDDLSEINEPFYLMDFVSQAAVYGLQYLGDADPRRDDIGDAPLRSEDWVESRQYRDYVKQTRFRESLLCRSDIPLDRRMQFDRFRNLFAASRVKPSDPEEEGQQRFDLPAAGNLTTNHPVAKQTLCRLASLWPESIRISELPLDDYSPGATAEMLMQLIQIGALDVGTVRPGIAACIGERPVGSALARAQIAEGRRRVTNQRHMSVELEDEISRRVLSLLDGSRNREMLFRDLAASGADPDMIRRTMENGLAGLHRLCLLTG